jgi:hypothetical protein
MPAQASPRVAARATTARAVIDYGLARRAALHGLRAGRLSPLDVCDAHPYLLRAARFHGEPTDRDCPVCRRESLVEVTYTYGDCFKNDTNGRVRRRAELAGLAAEHPEFTVYIVEVCQGCSWNHLTVSYVLGRLSVSPNGQSPRSKATRRAAEE